MGSKISAAFFWKFLERIGTQGISFILMLILARLLTPADYGTVALVAVFISLSTVIVQCGFNSALIQKKIVTDVDYTSGFIFSTLLTIILYMVLFLFAPCIAEFYHSKELALITRVLSLVLFPNAITSILIAKLSRELKFKAIFMADISAILISAIIGISMAWEGYGVWAIVVQQVIFQFINCIILLFTAKWKLEIKGVVNSFIDIFPFGSRILASNILVSIFLNLRTLIIGRVYSAGDLGMFNRGIQFPQALMESINGTMQTVLLPVYAREQESKSKLISMVRLSVRLSNYLIFPLLIGLSCIAEPMVQLLLTDKWLSCVPFIWYFSIAYLCQPIQIITAQAMRAIGDSKTPLKLEIVRKCIEVILLLITIPISVHAIGIGAAICGILSIVVAMKANDKVILYTIKEQIEDIMEPFCYSIFMVIIVFWTGSIIENLLLKILIQIFSGAISYLGISFFLHSKCLDELLDCIKWARENHDKKDISTYNL